MNCQQTILRDKRKSISVEQSERPQRWDQPKRVWWHKANNWSKYFLVSSKERWFRLVQIVYINWGSNRIGVFAHLWNIKEEIPIPLEVEWKIPTALVLFEVVITFFY